MRSPFSLTNLGLEEEARIKFSYTSPKLHQNIEVSIDGDETSVEDLLDSFHRFLNALGVSTPENVVLGFVELNEEEGGDGEEESK